MMFTRQGVFGQLEKDIIQEVRIMRTARHCKGLARHFGHTVGWQMYVKGFGALLNRIRVW